MVLGLCVEISILLWWL